MLMALLMLLQLSLASIEHKGIEENRGIRKGHRKCLGNASENALRNISENSLRNALGNASGNASENSLKSASGSASGTPKGMPLWALWEMSWEMSWGTPRETPWGTPRGTLWATTSRKHQLSSSLSFRGVLWIKERHLSTDYCKSSFLRIWKGAMILITVTDDKKVSNFGRCRRLQQVRKPSRTFSRCSF